MPHADHATLPSDVQTKADLYSHALTQLAALLDDRPHWISALANTSSLLYHLLNDWNASRSLAPVNWVGPSRSHRCRARSRSALVQASTSLKGCWESRREGIDCCSARSMASRRVNTSSSTAGVGCALRRIALTSRASAFLSCGIEDSTQQRIGNSCQTYTLTRVRFRFLRRPS